MTQNVTVPGVGTVQFPDGMSQQDMAAAIQKNFPQIHPKPAAPESALMTTGKRALGGLAGDVNALISGVSAIPQGFAGIAGAGYGAIKGLLDPNDTARNAAANSSETAMNAVRNLTPQINPIDPSIKEGQVAAQQGIGAVTNAIPYLTEKGIDLADKGAAKILPQSAQGTLAKVNASLQGIGNIAANLAPGAFMPRSSVKEPVLPEAPIKPGFFGNSIEETKNIVSRIIKPQQTADKAVGGILNRSATNPSAVRSTVPGQVPLSTAGTTLDPGMMSLERATRMRSTPTEGANEAFFQVLQQRNNSSIRGLFDKLGNTGLAPQEASTQAFNVLKNYYDAGSEAEKALWSKVPDNSKLNVYNTSSAVDKYIGNQTIANQRVIERAAGVPLGDFKAVIQHYAKNGAEDESVQVPFSEIKDIRSSLLEAKRNASINGDRNAARLLGGLDETILNSLGNENAFAKGAQTLGDSYNKARFYTSDFRGKQFTPDVMNYLDQDPSQMAGKVFSSPENIEAYLNATGHSKAAKNALANYMTSTLMDRSNVAGRGGIEQFTNGRTLTDYIQNNPQTLAKIFDAKQMATLKQIADLSKRNIAAESATPRIGSDTIGKGMQNAVLDSVAGKSRILNYLTKPYQGAMETSLRNAMLDPATAAKLMTDARNGAIPKFKPQMNPDILKLIAPLAAQSLFTGNQK